MKKKILTILIILLIVLQVVFSLFLSNISNALTDVTFMSFMENMNYGSYDNIMTLTPSEIYNNYRFDDGTTVDEKTFWKSEHQVQCLEKSKTTSSSEMKGYIIIDINNYDEATIYYEGNKVDGSFVDSVNAELAYISYYAEISGKAYSADFNLVKFTFANFWNEKYQSKLAGWLNGIGTPPNPTNGGASKSNPQLLDDAYYYANFKKRPNSDMDVEYKARIIILSGGSSQSRAILYGREDTPIKEATLSINKYISEVNGVPVEDRSIKTGLEKLYNPVPIEVGKDINEIVYTIPITNSGNVSATNVIFEDLFERGVFDGVEISDIEIEGATFTELINNEGPFGWEYSEESNSYGLQSFPDYRQYSLIRGTIYEIPATKTVTVKVKLKISGIVVNGIYVNWARCSYNGKIENWFDDYITINSPNLTINKYIDEANREKMSNEEKELNPIKRTTFEECKYTIPIKTTDNGNCNNVYFADVFDVEGLELVGDVLDAVTIENGEWSFGPEFDGYNMIHGYIKSVSNIKPTIVTITLRAKSVIETRKFENRALVWFNGKWSNEAKEWVEIEPPTIEVDKYITSGGVVRYGPMPTDEDVLLYGSDKINDAWKEANPVEVEAERIVDYEIAITGARSQNDVVDFVDEFDPEGLRLGDMGDITIEGAEWVEGSLQFDGNNRITGKITGIPEKSTATVKITLISKYVTIEKKFYNRSEITYNGVPKNSSDWITIKCPKLKVDKYIERIDGPIVTDIYGNEMNSNIIYGNGRSGLKDETKRNEAGEIYENDSIITYKIEISNEGEGFGKVLLEDKPDNIYEFVEADVSDLFGAGSSGNYEYVDGILYIPEFKVFPDLKRTIYIKLKYSVDDIYSRFEEINENLAIIKNPDDGTPIDESRDYTTPVVQDPAIINKYVVEIDGEAVQDRSKLSEVQKLGYEVLEDGTVQDYTDYNSLFAGYNDVEHLIKYKIDIYNPRSTSITGYFADFTYVDEEIERGLIYVDEYGNKVSDDYYNINELTLEGRELKTIEVYMKTPKEQLGEFINTAFFTYEEETITSSDKVMVSDKTYDGTPSIKKWISSVKKLSGGYPTESGTIITGNDGKKYEVMDDRLVLVSNVIPKLEYDREERDNYNRYAGPAIVEKGDFVTFTIELENNIIEHNVLGSIDPRGEYPKDEIDEFLPSDIFFADIYKSIKGKKNVLNITEVQAEIDNGSGESRIVRIDDNNDYDYYVTYEKTDFGEGSVTFRNVPYKAKRRIYVTVEVIASDMTIENLVGDIDPDSISSCAPTKKLIYWVERKTTTFVENIKYDSVIFDDDGNIIAQAISVNVEPQVVTVMEPDGYPAGKWNNKQLLDILNHTGWDGDYIRVLDPIVEGNVWEDVAVDGLFYEKDGDFKLQYADIIVKLWKYNGDDVENAIFVDSTRINSNGHYSFGRVKKGSKGGSDNWTHTENTPSFCYELDAEIVQYFITFEYNGVTYGAVTYEGSKNDLRRKRDEDGTLVYDTAEEYNYQIDSIVTEETRDDFSKNLETIAYNRAFDGISNLDESMQLEYNVIPGDDDELQKSLLAWNCEEIEKFTEEKVAESGELTYRFYKNKLFGEPSSSTQAITMIARTPKFFFEDKDNLGEISYLFHIDMGLKNRGGNSDLSLTKDVVNAEVTVNNHQTLYDYGKLGTAPYVATENNTLAEPYKLELYREDYEYRTANNNSTIIYILNQNNNYKSFGRTNDLEVILTYKITIKNESSINAVVREVIDYSPKELSLLGSPTLDTGEEIDGEAFVSWYENTKYNEGDIYCDQIFIHGDALNNRVIPANGTLDIYLKYKVLKNYGETGSLKIDYFSEKLEDSKFNIAEIGAYSFYNLDGSVAGVVDIDSNPGNIEFDSNGKPIIEKFEDDTFETGILVGLKDNPAPPIDPPTDETTPTPPTPTDPPTDDSDPTPPPTTSTEIIDKGERGKECYRNITGIVFEEKNKPNYSDGQLVGDGIKNGKDEPAENVLVKLYEVVQDKINSQDYLVDTGLWYRTGSDGRYYFGDTTEKFTKQDGLYKPNNSSKSNESTNDWQKIHAGNYVVRFIYGDEAEYLDITDGNTIRYSGQDFKSVKYTNVDGKEDNSIVSVTDFAKVANGKTKIENLADLLKSGTKIVSVAKDNEVRRLEVNAYSTTTTYPMDTVLKAKNSSEAKLLAEHTSMFADTKIFDMDIEYTGNYKDVTNKVIDGINTTIEKLYYSVRDINFGLIERPKAKLQLMDDISEIKAVTSDGNTLMDIFYDINYTQNTDGSVQHTTTLNKEKSKGFEQLQSLDRKGANQGFRYANIDTDILQGMTITIKYQIAVANIGEVDHITKWLNDEIENSNVELNVNYGTQSGENPRVEISGNEISDIIGNEKRNYNYESSYLYRLLNNGDSGRGINAGLNSCSTQMYNYPNLESNDIGSTAVRKAYTYNNIKKIQDSYSTGYYLGNTYYNNVTLDDEIRVGTRVDQIVDYVDNDLVFKPEENVNNEGQGQFLTYTTKEIAQKGLLKDVSDSIKRITDGERDYYNEDLNSNNNVAFNIEDGNVNKDLYKFMKPTIYGGEIQLYEIELQASKMLTSEVDIEGIVIDNISEIVKTSNTVGRKVYVKGSGTDSDSTGFIGNTTEVVDTVGSTPGTSTKIVEVSRTNLDLDTDFTEYVTFSPPTGDLKQIAVEKIGNALLIIVPVAIIIAGVSYIAVQFAKKKILQMKSGKQKKK